MQCHALVAQFFEAILYVCGSAFDMLPRLRISIYFVSTQHPTHHPNQLFSFHVRQVWNKSQNMKLEKLFFSETLESFTDY